MLKIGINASGGDDPVQAMLGAYRAAINNPEVEVKLYLELKHCHLIDANIMMFPRAPENLTFVEVEIDKIKDLHASVEALSKGEINALITASNSKSLAGCTHTAKMWERPHRPGLLAPVPTKIGTSYIIDVGATARVDEPRVFKGWAELGTKFLQAHCQIAEPTIGLCNIATERAYPELKKIHQLLKKEVSNYIGYKEPYQFVDGEINLWLMEGFVGNENLKLLESYMRFLTFNYLRLIDDEQFRDRIRRRAKDLFSYEAHLISPYLTESGCWIFRVHGAAKADDIAKAFTLAQTKYNLNDPMW